ncbi:hypothetical protein [Pseudoroseicyclus tamaricis]|uniref:TRAP-type C4-dicarboxylate transport system substrate-binding protein n=1 Tax=Pseudoroseicyclus tamaricis TaxID=2705421 RepID=A0A6B2K6C7_9RHOB|nr:hypothetical protein [Pseudoroseicyclus tamaricis]NDV02426.1 hypothetical protein [Pseudoroseicyclus tamaricis]
MSYHFKTALAATGLALTLGAPAHAQSTRVLVNCFFPPQHFVCTDVLGTWAQDVSAATEGRVQVAILPSNMAPPPEQLTSTRDGVFDAALQMNVFIANEVTGIQLGMLPFTGTADSRANSLALWSTYEEYFAEADEYEGVELLSVYVAPGADFYSLDGTPILSVQDLADKKMWAAAGLVAEELKDLGSPVVSGPAVQMTELIQRGVVDGFVGIPATDAQVFNVLPPAESITVTDRKISTPAFSFFINSDVWAEISPEDQEAIRALSGAAWAEKVGTIFTEVEAGVHEEIAGMMEVHEASPEFEQALIDAAQPYIDAWIEEASAKGIDGQAALDFYMAEIQRLTAE